MKTPWKAFWIVLALITTSRAQAYHPITHSFIADYAMQQSILNDPERGVLENLGLGNGVDDKNFLLPTTHSESWMLTPKRLVQYGAAEEDEGVRAVNHFFDSQDNGRPLTYLGVPIGKSSPDWGLEDAIDFSAQEFSYKDASTYLYEALALPTKKQRDRSLGRVFESLGHIIHLLQDMAQPQHVRNDIHCDELFTRLFGSFIYRAPICPATLAYRPSEYEKHTIKRGAQIPLAGYGEVDYGTFDIPRKLWENSGKGLAEFTSTNFVSVGTNFQGGVNEIQTDGTHKRPNGQSAMTNQIQIETLLGPAGPDQPLRGQIWFISTPLEDKYRPEGSATNSFTSSYSIFNSDLDDYGTDLVFTLNRFNYNAANEFLLPRAAAFSTGLINYFFRGNIEISAPAEGVYGVVDHAQKSAGEGFTKIKMALRNATPEGGGVPQEMPGGTLLAVAKYVRNACYQDDLSGEFGGIIDYFGGTITPSGCSIVTYLSGQEEISVSAPIVAASLDPSNATEIEFDFAHAPIPIDSRDVVMQVVYSGMLGEETDAVVVGAKNIAEPTYIAIFNSSDYFQLDGQIYKPEEIRSDPTLTARVDFDHDGDVDEKDINIDPEPLHDIRFGIGDHFLTEGGTLEPRNYSRLAVLADAEEPIPVRIQSRFESTFGSDKTYNVSPLETQLEREPYVLSALGKPRGVHSWFMLFVAKHYGPGSPPPDVVDTLEPLPSDPGPRPVTLSSP